MRWVAAGRPAFCGRGAGQRQREYDARFGAGNWRVCHRVAGESLELAEAARHVEASYREFFLGQPEVLAWLCTTACDVIQFATSNVRSGRDYHLQERKQQHVYDIAVRRVLAELGCELRGDQLLQIGGRGCTAQLLNPGLILFYKPELIAQPALGGWWSPDSIECFWQSNRVLEVRVES